MTTTRYLPKGPAPLCGCGCGQPTVWNSSKNHWAAHIKGHQNIGRPSALRLERPPAPLCACGCGQPVITWRYRRGWVTYLNHHAPRQPHTPEAIEKMRQAALARSEQTSAQSRNRIWTPESREKVRQAKLAMSTETSRRMSGEGNPAWRGGRDYFAERDTSLNTYQRGKLYSIIRQRDHLTCVLCGKQATYRALDTHHLDGDLAHNEPANLVTLCHACHMAIEFGKERAALQEQVAAYMLTV